MLSYGSVSRALEKLMAKSEGGVSSPTLTPFFFLILSVE
jgi:hypothetical protein